MIDLDKKEKLRLTALDRAISSGAGKSYNDDGMSIINPDKILEAASKFEKYLKGTIING